jgi:hypothetical protein
VTTAQNLIDSIEIHIRDPDNSEITTAQLVTLLADAVHDARGKGVLIPLEDDESLTFAASDYDYSPIPAAFAYIHVIKVENTDTSPSTWDVLVPYHFWDVRIDGGIPVLYFSRAFSIPAGKKMKLVGQARPTIPTGVSSTIDPGLEPFLRERAASHALGFMAAGVGELDRTRLNLSEIKKRDSELLLQSLDPQEFRVRPNAKHVPGR